jgi:hypothetical protein
MSEKLWYFRCEKALVRDADRLRREAATRQLEYLIFDSVGFATEGPPESAEAALGYFQAIRTFGPIGSLHLAHINKTDGAEQKPFGSAFWHNSARATWFVKPSDEDPDVASIGIFERKRNVGRKRPAFGFSVKFAPGRTTFERIDLASVPDLAVRLPMAKRIANSVKGGAKSREAIATELEVRKPETFRRVLNREIRWGRLIRFPGPGGEERIGLPERNQP